MNKPIFYTIFKNTKDRTRNRAKFVTKIPPIQFENRCTQKVIYSLTYRPIKKHDMPQSKNTLCITSLYISVEYKYKN